MVRLCDSGVMPNMATHLATWLFPGQLSYRLALPESGAGKPPV